MLRLTPEEAYSESFIQNVIKKAGFDTREVSVRILKRSIDARKSRVWVNVQAEIYVKEQFESVIAHKKYLRVENKEPVIIVGAGPAGLFAALRFLELGIKPIILERGKDVRARRRDLAAINKDHIVNPESNYCFGEGGAGTYSDGKLYTRSKKRGDLNRILEILVAHGANDDILYEAHPHIGTNKLPKLVQALRETIIDYGGEVHFDTKVIDFVIQNDEIKGVRLESRDTLTAKSVLLATGHSARDIFNILSNKKIKIEAKPFALGVRVEHPQQLIDKIQYSCEGSRGDYLPASSYALVNQTYLDNQQRGVFSFCMCPGGFIVPAATSPGEIVVNGMSPSRRDSQFANSGIVVAVEHSDLKEYQKYGELSAMHFQQDIERKAFEYGGKSQVAPAQRLVDFVKGKVSAQLNETSYQPGLASVNMSELLPGFISERLKMAFKGFGKKMHGYLTNEAQIIGVESRTSSPVRIPRDKETLEHVSLKRLFPCAEGAGYAGGIVSAAMDGERCAEAIFNKYY